MNCFDRLTALRIAASVLVGFLVTPISGASTIATTQQELVAMHVGVATPGAVSPTVLPPFIAADVGGEGERLQPIGLLVAANESDISRSLLTRFPPTGPSNRPDAQMGLQLPEPGPLSAIIATLALAGFVMFRRVV